MPNNGLTFSIFGQDVSLGRTLESLPTKAGEEGKKAGQSLSQQFGESAKSGMEATKGKIGEIVGGLGIAAVIATQITEGWQRLNVAKLLGAKLGLDPADAKEAGNVAGEVYSEGFGDSLDTVTQTVGQVEQALGKLNKADLDEVTTSAMAFSDAFGTQTQDSINAVAQLLRTGLAKNAKEAFDVIAAGEQSGLDKTGTLLSTLTKYSTVFRQLGLDGGQALGVIDQGMKAGAKDSAYVASALQRFVMNASRAMVTTVDPAKVKAAAEQVKSAEQSAAEANQSAEEKISDAQRGIRQAVAAAARATQQAAEQVKAAQAGIVQAHRDAAAGIRTADANVSQSETALANSQRSAKDAQVALSEARADAAQQIRDLADQLTDSQLSQKDASLNLIQARQELAKVNTDPTSTVMDRERAQLAVEQAVQALKEQTEQTGDLKTEKAKADKDGVNGSEQVKEAQERVKEATEDVAKAQRAVIAAQAAVLKAQRDGAAEIARSQAALAKAEDNRNHTAEIGAQHVAAARRAEADAATQEARTAASGAQTVSRALDALHQAQTPQLTALGLAYQQLGVNGSKIAEEIAKGGKPASAALEEVLSKLRSTKDPAERARLAYTLFGRSASQLGQALYALDPATAKSAPGLAKIEGAAGRVTKAISSTKSPLSILERQAGETFGKIGAAALPVLQPVLTLTEHLGPALAAVAIGWAAWEVASKAAAGVKAVTGAIKGLGGAQEADTAATAEVTEATDTATVSTGELVAAINEATAAIKGLGIAQQGQVATTEEIVAAQGELATATEGATVAQGELDAAMDANPIGLIVAAIALLVVGVIYAWKHFSTFREVIEKAFTVIKDVAKFIANIWLDQFKLLWKAVKAVGDGFTWLWSNAIEPAFDAIKDHWKLLLGILTGGFSTIIQHWRSIWGAVRAVWSNVIEPVFGGIKSAAVDMWHGIRDDVLDPFLSAFKSTWHTLERIGDGIGSVFTSLWDGIEQGAVTAFNAIATLWNDTVGKVSFHLPSWIPGIGGDGFSMPTIPLAHLAQGTGFWRGGMAMVGEFGPELVNIPRGSAVYPHTQSMSMMNRPATQTHIHIHVNGVAVTEPGVRRAVVAALEQFPGQIKIGRKVVN